MSAKPPVFWNPRSYQKTGVVLMLRQAAAGILYKPGLGKTTVVYMACRILLEKGFVKKTLVIAPIKPAYNVWPAQKYYYEDFKHLRVGLMHGADKESVLHDDNFDLYVMNPDGLMWLLQAHTEEYTTAGGKKKKRVVVDQQRLAWLKSRFQMLVVDESTDFRDTTTNRFKLLEYLLRAMKRRYILSGTPMPKTIQDWFGQIYVLDMGDALGRFITHFRTRYMYPDPGNPYGWLPQPGAFERMSKRIAPLVQVVEQKGNVDLPDVVYNDVWVDLPPAVRLEYNKMYRALVAQVESGNIVAANSAVASSKCRQICNGAIYHSEAEEEGEYTPLHTEKYEALRGILAELSGDPLLITYEFKFDRDTIEELLGVPCISTGNARKDNDRITQFSRGELPAVMGHPKSISLGIDGLQDSCCNIAMIGCPWSLLYYEQIIDRVKRVGNKSKKITVHRILARNTLDERVLEVLDDRDRDQTSFMKLLKGLR
jgi:hypothetical protein